MLIRWIAIVGSLVLVLSGTPVVAQSSADAYFHEAAQQYVAGNKEAAQQAVERGLEVAPSDLRLQALQQKLDQESQDRGGGGGSQQGTPNQQQDEQSEGDEGQRQESDASGEEGQNEGAQDEQASDAQSPQSQQPGGGGQAGGGGPRPGTQSTLEGEPAKRNALTRDQAARLLRALQNQEMKLLREVQGRASETETSVEKDW
jgi:hypothetical protein